MPHQQTSPATSVAPGTATGGPDSIVAATSALDGEKATQVADGVRPEGGTERGGAHISDEGGEKKGEGARGGSAVGTTATLGGRAGGSSSKSTVAAIQAGAAAAGVVKQEDPAAAAVKRTVAERVKQDEDERESIDRLIEMRAKKQLIIKGT